MPDQYVAGSPQQGWSIAKRALDALTNMPQPHKAPLNGLPVGAQPQLPVPTSPEQHQMPSGYVQEPAAYDHETQTPGYAHYDGPKLNTEAALAGLKSHEDPPAPYISTEELYKHAFGDPHSMAAGAPQMAGDELKDRTTAEDFNTAMARKQQETVQGAMTGMHPAVQEGKEADAIRAAYPAQAQGQGAMQAAQIGGQSRVMASINDLQGRQASRDGQGASAVMRGLMDALQPRAGEGDQEKQQRVHYWLTLLDQMQKGKLFGNGAPPSGAALDGLDSDY